MPSSPIANAQWDAMIKQAAIDAGTTTEKARQVMKAIADSIISEMNKNNDYEVTNFGTFTVGRRAGRNGRNPRTKAPIKIPSRMVCRFRLTQHLKIRVRDMGFAP